MVKRKLKHQFLQIYLYLKDQHTTEWYFISLDFIIYLHTTKDTKMGTETWPYLRCVSPSWGDKNADDYT